MKTYLRFGFIHWLCGMFAGDIIVFCATSIYGCSLFVLEYFHLTLMLIIKKNILI